MKKYVLIFIISIVLTLVTMDSHKAIRYVDYKEVLSALLNISSIIFAIIGAWIAIIYPKAISKTFNKNDSLQELKKSRSDTTYLAKLVEIVMVSAVVLMVVLSMQFLYPLLKNLDYLGINVFFIKSAAFFILTLLTIIQMHVVFRVILANYFFLNELRKKDIKDEVDKLHE